MAKYSFLDTTGLQELWSRIKSYCAPKASTKLLSETWASGSKTIVGSSAYSEFLCVLRSYSYRADIALHRGSDGVVRGCGIAMADGSSKGATTNIVAVRLTASGDTMTGSFQGGAVASVKVALDDVFASGEDTGSYAISELYGVR